MSEFERWLREVIKEMKKHINELFNVVNGEGEKIGLKTKVKVLEGKMKIHDEFKKKIDGIVWKLALVGFLVVVSGYTLDRLAAKQSKSGIQSIIQQEIKNAGMGGP